MTVSWWELFFREGEEESAGEAPGVSAPFINSGRVGGGGRMKGAVRAALRMAGEEIMATAVKVTMMRMLPNYVLGF